MKNLILICVVCVQLGWSSGYPANQGVGAFAYQDSTGNRYGGTYGLNDGQIYPISGDKFENYPNFVPLAGFDQNVDDFFPEYFKNFENLLQQAFNQNFEQQRLALDAAKQAFDLTSNHAGYIPDFPTRFDFGGFDNMFGQNAAFAGASLSPGFSHQTAGISPPNPAMPNVNVMNFSDQVGKPGFYGVQTSSYSSSSDINGQKQSNKQAETIINDNGKVTKYSVRN